MSDYTTAIRTRQGTLVGGVRVNREYPDLPPMKWRTEAPARNLNPVQFAGEPKDVA